MSGEMVDITVTNYCERIYALQSELEVAPAADDVSRGDYKALLLAVQALYVIVCEKLGAAT